MSPGGSFKGYIAVRFFLLSAVLAVLVPVLDELRVVMGFFFGETNRCPAISCLAATGVDL
jgi:hypothetical protein